MPHPSCFYSMETDPVPIIQEAEWATGPVWTGAENLAPPLGFDLWTIHPIVNSVLAVLSLLIHFLFDNGSTISRHSHHASQYTLPISLQAFKGITIQCFWVYVKPDMLHLLSPCRVQIISFLNSSFGGLIR
jgi:hypothetical protein